MHISRFPNHHRDRCSPQQTAFWTLALVIAVVLTALTVPGPARADFAWQSPTDLSVAGRQDPNPQVAMAPDGTATATWHSYNADHVATVQSATRQAGAPGFSPPVDLSAPGGNAADPQIAVASDGATTITWRRFDGSNWIVQTATRPPGPNATFSAPVNLSADGRDAADPQIAVASGGTTVVTWTRRNDSGDSIAQVAIRPAGPNATFGSPIDLSAPGHDAVSPQVAVADDGATTVTWSRYDGTGYSLVQATTRPAGTDSGFGSPIDLSPPGKNAYNPQVAIASDGATTITWHEINGGTGPVRAATRPAGINSFISTGDLSAPDNLALNPQLAIAPDGATTITWFRYHSGGHWIVQAATRPAGPNTTFGPPVDLTADGRDAADPQIAMGPDGATTITWSRRNNLGDGVVQVSTRSAGSGSFGTPDSIFSPDSNGYRPQIATAPGGVITLVWFRYTNGGSTIVQASSRVAPLTVTRSGKGQGTVTSSSGGIRCGTACRADLAPSARVTLTATASAGSRFAGWSGSGCSGTDTCTLAMDDAKSVDAAFAPVSSGTPQPRTTPTPTPTKSQSPKPAPTRSPSPAPPSKACAKAKQKLKKATTRKQRKAAKKAVALACRK